MAKPRIAAKYTSESGEFYNGIPARDLMEDEFSALTDEQKATLRESAFYDLRHDAPKEAEKAARHIEKETAAQAPADAVSVTVAGADGPAPKDEARK